MATDTSILLIDRKILAEVMIELRGARPTSACAHRADVAPAVWRSWELRNSWPQPFQFSQILKGLGCTPEQFDRAVWQRMTRRMVERGLDSFEYSENLEGPPETMRQAMSHVLKTYATMLYGAAIQIEQIHDEFTDRD